MVKRTKVALLIITYNWPEALRLVLESVLMQQVLPDEVIIADDGSGAPTRNLIDSYRDKFPVPLKHFWHRDLGFRKTTIMNKAIAGTSCDYIIQVDGDIMLSPHFIKDHISVAEKGYYIRGSRVLLSESRTKRLLREGRFDRISPFSKGIKNRINALRILALSPLFIKKSKRSRNLAGCNCAYWRSDFIKVNGYNNDLKGWGHEDIELAARFINAGLSQKKVKMKAVCYHLHHPFHDRKHEDVNFKVYTDVLRKGITYCSNGFHNQYSKQEQEQD